MPRSRSPSRSPHRDERKRSRSPRRRYEHDRDQPRRREGGFRWKDKRRPDDDSRREQDRGLQRGYRERERARSPHREREQRDSYRNNGDDNRPKREDRSGRALPPGEDRDRRDTQGEKKKKEKKPAAPAAPSEPMIIVHINDRLGTKAAIPCLASDPIRLFKAQVAARIGREPHEILLKRQGERPFKDQLTLEDYGVSNGVQLDLEVDTGD
ncbi:hypothetical protein AJ80_07334 [Polytolypa hystricis UAMH7299]|uniref:Ubiquitin-like modifier HUB1 n=1 Tax=Polytolypa hystricis (strain UAMH7299) TaxID=1447883 RepID=A0A2B7XQ41_POLH7|nr:hypothetical protein AJ80_07334 [Polytolypa hystricis UAMH7299]